MASQKVENLPSPLRERVRVRVKGSKK